MRVYSNPIMIRNFKGIKMRIEAAGNSYDASAAAEIVMDELINQTLLAQAAVQGWIHL